MRQGVFLLDNDIEMVYIYCIGGISVYPTFPGESAGSKDPDFLFILLDKELEICYIYSVWGLSVYPIPLDSLPGRKTRIFFA